MRDENDIRTIIDHEALVEWVGEHGGAPATVVDEPVQPGEEAKVGELAIHFEGYNDDRVADIDWEDFLTTFEDRKLAMVVDATKPAGSPADVRFTSRVRLKNGVFDA